MIAWAVRDLTKRFEGVTIGPLSFAIAPGERIAIIGASGCGKSTTVRAGLGLVRRDSGAITILGEDATGWDRRRWARARRDVQLLFQDPRTMLDPNLPLGWLLRESAALHVPDRDPVREARRVLEEVDLAGREDCLPHELSGGERRRAGLARVLLARPRLLVCDEPTAGLDAALKASLLGLVMDRVGPGCAVVLVSHDLPAVAWATRRVLVLHRGRLVDDFPTAALRDPSEPRHPHTVALMRAAGLSAPPPRTPDAS